jgi:hypothetical protein
VVEGGDRERLLAEAGEPVGSGGEFGRQHLEGDLAVEPRVARKEDAAHPALAQQAEDQVGTDGLSGFDHRVVRRGAATTGE